MYRDLTNGVKGDDVYRFQTALRDAGYAIYDADGSYGASTALAVERLYQAGGYRAPTSDGDPSSADSSVDSQKPGLASEKKTSKFVVAKKAEFLMVPRLPSTFAKTDLERGSAAAKGTMTFNLSEPTISAEVNPVDAVAAANSWTANMPPTLTVGAPLIGALNGLNAGLYPSMRAARVQPVEAFRRT